MYFHQDITSGYAKSIMPSGTLSEKHLLARLRFRHLQLIAEVERVGSLSKAAEALSLTQPAMSKALKEIEGMLGFSLFTRGARGLQKTAQGAIVTHAAALILKELTHMQAEADAAGPEGRVAATLRIGTGAFLAVSLVPRVIAHLLAGDPPVRVTLREAYVPSLFAELLEGNLDALITVYDADAMAATADRGIRFEKFAEEDYAVIVPAGHRLARKRKVAWKELTAEPWVLTRKPSLARVFIEDTFRREGLAPPLPFCETESPVTSARIVAEGVGVSCTPDSTAIEAERSGRVKRLRMQTAPPSATLGLVYRSAAQSHPRIQLLRAALAGIGDE